MSEKALALLSKTTFQEGLVAGVSSTVVIAHKFGEFISSTNMPGQDVELHDCGIIYAQLDPYFLCIMTKGNSIEELQKVIAQISLLAYQVNTSH